ncbi:DUF5068 domain-containing protein [Bacillus infantis]|uniref:DUF5068 domain-containing protein n=1 Tax=Bacillus infantis TaxID=324767 RepID=UPI001CD5529A|nr:DUF5068 domain-containing protein [Bacillus infantis]MCA1034182.1 DUF5068 domain-containing protein [Bacillus infantis]
MKKNVLWTALMSLMLLLSACGNDEKASNDKEPEKKVEAEETEHADAEEETDESGKVEEAEETAEGTSAEGELLNPNIADESEGDAEVIYTNSDPGFVHDMKGFKVSVDEYQIVKVTDMREDVTIPFNDEIDGYVITAKVTVDNGTDKAMYYNNMHRIQTSHELDWYPSDPTFILDEDKVKSRKESETGKFAAGEKVTGLISFTLTNAEFEKLSTVKPKYIIEGGAADNDQFKGSIQGNAVFDFVYSNDQKSALASGPSFYQDRLTTDNMADKKMIFEKEGIGETQKIGDVNVTLEGVQYTEITPTEANKPRFENFGDSGIVALTVKFKIDNQSSEPLSIWNIGSILSVDDDRARVLAQGMVEPRDPQTIEAGAQGEKLHVFLFRKDEFEIFKKFNLEFGPFYNEDGTKAFKGRTAEFTLPR